MKNVKTVIKAVVAASSVAAALIAVILAFHFAGRSDPQGTRLPEGMSEIIEPLLPEPREDTAHHRDVEDVFLDLPHHGEDASPEDPDIPEDNPSDADKIVYQSRFEKETPASCPTVPDLDNPDEDIDIPKPSYEDAPAPRPGYDGTEEMCPTVADTTQGVDNRTEFEKESH